MKAATVGEDRQSSALALVALADSVAPVPRGAVAASGGSLSQRVHRLSGVTPADDHASRRPSWLISSLLSLLVALGLLVANCSALQINNDDQAPTVEQLAQQVAKIERLRAWKVRHADKQPSVIVDGFRGYRMVLHQGWPVNKAVQTQQVGAIDFTTVDDEWEFVLVPIKPARSPAKLKSQIQWQDSKCPYHTQDICLGEGHGYTWYTRGTLFYQHIVRDQLKLTGGDDPIQILVDGLLVDDKGGMTANSVPGAIAKHGDEALPYIRKAIEKAGETNTDPWRAATCLRLIHTDQATALLLQLFDSGDRNRRRAAMYSLIHEPFREAAKEAYLGILRERYSIPQVTKACLQFGWQQEALPILQEIEEKPNHIPEYRDALRGGRALAGKPIAPELIDAEQTMRSITRRDRDAELDKEIAAARRLLIESDDADAANLSALLLAIMTNKANVDPVRAAGIDILHARPKTSTIEFLRSLAERLPENRRPAVEALLNQVIKGRAQKVAEDTDEKIAWGDAVNGLRAGISHTDFPAIHPPDRVRIGDNISAQLIIQNVSDAAIEFTAIAASFQAPTVHDADGKPVMVSIPPYNGPAHAKKYRVNAGESVTIPLHTCSVAPRPMIDNLHGYHVFAGLGHYKLSATLALGGFNNEGWIGKLTTGRLDVEVVATDEKELTNRLASALKSRAATLSCKVVYLGPPEPRLRSVGLMTASFTDQYPAPWTLVTIDEQTANSIIDFLADEGHLYRHAADQSMPGEFPQPSYFLALETSPKRPGSIMIPLGWSAMKPQLEKLRDVVGGAGGAALAKILEQPMFTDWQQVTAGALVALSVERQLYQRANDPHFYLRFRLTNRTKNDVFVDLHDYDKVFYPNQWGCHRQPQRLIIDEERVTADVLDEQQKKDLIKQAAAGKLTRIPANQTIDYFREFNAGGRADVEAQQQKFGKYLIVSIDGQLRTTDGNSVENVDTEWTHSRTEQATDVVIVGPVGFARLPADALVIEP